MLARRELSQAQVRDRLTRRGHEPGSVDDAIARLTAERAIDDGRLAEAIARAEVHRRHGRRKVLQRMEHAGLERSLARQAVARVFAAVDEKALIEAALDRRLRDGRSIEDDAELRRLYRFLVGQGFDGDLALRALKARSVK
jgi:regulatory protein